MSPPFPLDSYGYGTPTFLVPLPAVDTAKSAICYLICAACAAFTLPPEAAAPRLWAPQAKVLVQFFKVEGSSSCSSSLVAQNRRGTQYLVVSTEVETHLPEWSSHRNRTGWRLKDAG
eukprot:1195327-Prorocentrum_minimum.AAC.4